MKVNVVFVIFVCAMATVQIYSKLTDKGETSNNYPEFSAVETGIHDNLTSSTLKIKRL